MLKNKNLSLIKVFFYSLVATSFVSILFVAIFSIVNDYKLLKLTSENTLKQFTQHEKDNIQSSNSRLHGVLLINYENLKSFFGNSGKQQLLGSKLMANSLFTKLKDIKSQNDILSELKQNFQLKDRTGMHSIYKLDGEGILTPFAFKKEDIKKFIDNPEIASKKEYLLEDNKTKVLTYAIRAEEAKILILYSYDVRSIKKNFAKNVENIISSIKTNKEEYIYIFDKSKNEILFSNFSNNTNIEKTKFYTEVIAKDSENVLSVISNPQKDGFLERTYEKDKNTNNKQYGVIAYVIDMPEFDWALSIGFFTDTLMSKVQAEQKIIKNDFINKILAYIFYLMFVLAIIFIINIFVKIIFDNTFSRFLNFFSQAHNENKLIPINEVVFKEFRSLANDMNQAIEAKNERERERNENLLFLNQYKNAVDISSVLSKTDKFGVITFVNDAFCKISGYTSSELIGNTHKLVRHPKVKSDIYKEAWSNIQTNKMWQGIFKNLSKNNEEYYIKTTIIPILDTKGEIKEYIGIANDITDVVNQSKKIQSNLQDGLTNLPSRTALIEDINKDLANSVVASFDISKFKHINEYYGFSVGDEILVEISRQISRLITNKNLQLYKLNSDNFALLGKKDAWNAQSLSKFCFELADHFKTNPIYINDNKFEIDLVFGVSEETCFFITSEMAKDYAKASETYVVNFSNKKEILMKNVKITQSLKKAIEEDRITVFKQGIIDNKTKQIMKYECLVRMIDEEGKIVSPFVFLEIAKSTKLYPKLTKIVIEKTFRYFSKNNERFSLNFSIEDILSPNIVNFLKEKLKEYPQLCNRLVVEIVEDEGIENFDEIAEFIEEIKSMGIGIAIDDFGSGYSNFEYLVKLKADTVKIDGSLIKNIDKNPQMLDVVRLIVEFAKKTNLKTIAEFVSSKEIADIVDELGINASQGFYYDEPKPLEI